MTTNLTDDARARLEAVCERLASSEELGRPIFIKSADLRAVLSALSTAEAELVKMQDAAVSSMTVRDLKIAELQEALADSVREMEGVTVFVNSRQRIKQPEGSILWRRAIDTARAALESSREPTSSGANEP